jgi:hypothetical protein
MKMRPIDGTTRITKVRVEFGIVLDLGRGFVGREVQMFLVK